MTMRTDALAACKTGTGDDGKPVCSTGVVVTDAHWAEAKKAVGDDREMQAKYLRNEAIAACKAGCKCVQNVVGWFTLDKVVAFCGENSGDQATVSPHTFTKS